MAKISVNNLASAIYESLEGKGGAIFDSTITNAINLIKDKHMMGKKDLILDRIQEIIDSKNKIIRAKISTKTKITEKTSNEIKDFIKKKYKAEDVILEEKEDKTLLGGIKIEIGDEIIDMTLKNKLYQLNNYLITN